MWSDIIYSNLKREFDCTYFFDTSYKSAAHEQNPDWIFFPHWSEIIPESIYTKFKCIVIHPSNLPSNLPKGRGGTPLQNQILDGVTETRVNAIKVEKNIDSGDVYCSLPITLQGTITDIWISMADRICQLIRKCIIEDPTPKKQVGEIQIYKRNKNNVLPLDTTTDIIDIYKFIQMLDGETYPNAFIKIGNFRLEFSRSKIIENGILSDVIIRRKNE